MPVAGVQWNHRFVVGRPRWAPLARTERSLRDGQNAPFVKRMIKSFWERPRCSTSKSGSVVLAGRCYLADALGAGGRRFESSHPDHLYCRAKPAAVLGFGP